MFPLVCAYVPFLPIRDDGGLLDFEAGFPSPLEVSQARSQEKSAI
jgi:hypothetical protein